jgi:hypothetical protein
MTLLAPRTTLSVLRGLAHSFDNVPPFSPIVLCPFGRRLLQADGFGVFKFEEDIYVGASCHSTATFMGGSDGNEKYLPEIWSSGS